MRSGASLLQGNQAKIILAVIFGVLFLVVLERSQLRRPSGPSESSNVGMRSLQQYQRTADFGFQNEYDFTQLKDKLDEQVVKDRSSVCSEFRFVERNVATYEECKALQRLTRVSKRLLVGDQQNGADVDDIIRAGGYDQKDLEVYAIMRNITLRYMRKHFRTDTIHHEYSVLSVRPPGTLDYSHGLHVDSCRMDFNTEYCTPMKDACCEWRSHTAVLMYSTPENQVERGEFLYKSVPWNEEFCGTEDLVVPCECGNLVGLVNSKEGVHGVNKVHHGERYALTMWFTTHKKYFDKRFKHLGDDPDTY